MRRCSCCQQDHDDKKFEDKNDMTCMECFNYCTAQQCTLTGRNKDE